MAFEFIEADEEGRMDDFADALTTLKDLSAAISRPCKGGAVENGIQ